MRDASSPNRFHSKFPRQFCLKNELWVLPAEIMWASKFSSPGERVRSSSSLRPMSRAAYITRANSCTTCKVNHFREKHLFDTWWRRRTKLPCSSMHSKIIIHFFMFSTPARFWRPFFRQFKNVAGSRAEPLGQTWQCCRAIKPNFRRAPTGKLEKFRQSLLVLPIFGT